MNKPLSIQKYLMVSYLLYSFLVIILGLFVFGPFGNMHHAQGTAALEWSDYAEKYLGYLLIPSFYVMLFGLIQVLKLNGGRKIGAGFFVISTIIGLLTLFIARSNEYMGHLDCGTNCVSSVLSYQAINQLLLWLVPALVILPAIFACVFFWLYRKK